MASAYQRRIAESVEIADLIESHFDSLSHDAQIHLVKSLASLAAGEMSFRKRRLWLEQLRKESKSLSLTL